jgi:hypothetical protein
MHTHTFERQDTRQTLAQGIAEYYRANPNLSRVRDMSPEAQEFFRCHDTAHVVFGCSTALPHEAVVKLSSVFGTTGGFGVLRGYKLHESVAIYSKLRPTEVVATLLQAVVLVPRTIFRCMRQRKRWPWSDFATYEAVPLAELRAEFGIRVAEHSNRHDA